MGDYNWNNVRGYLIAKKLRVLIDWVNCILWSLVILSLGKVNNSTFWIYNEYVYGQTT